MRELSAASVHGDDVIALLRGQLPFLQGRLMRKLQPSSSTDAEVKAIGDLVKSFSKAIVRHCGDGSVPDCGRLRAWRVIGCRLARAGFSEASMSQMVETICLDISEAVRVAAARREPGRSSLVAVTELFCRRAGRELMSGANPRLINRPAEYPDRLRFLRDWLDGNGTVAQLAELCSGGAMNVTTNWSVILITGISVNGQHDLLRLASDCATEIEVLVPGTHIVVTRQRPLPHVALAVEARGYVERRMALQIARYSSKTLGLRAVASQSRGGISSLYQGYAEAMAKAQRAMAELLDDVARRRCR